MSRQPRKISKSGMYHIIFRGANKQNIFCDDTDYKKLSDIIMKIKYEYNMKIYAYCFMTNHVHLFMHESEPGTISCIMKKILTAYAVWYNKKYDRSGPLFEGRYRSENVEDDYYVVNLVKYIHMNPVKALIADNIDDYKFSSYSEYLKGTNGITDVDFVLGLIDDDIEKAKTEFLNLHSEYGNEAETENFQLELKLSHIVGKILTIADCKNLRDVRNLTLRQKKELVCNVLADSDVRSSHLAELIGVSRQTVAKLMKN